MRKLKIVFSFLLCVILFGCSCNKTELPKPEKDSGFYGEMFGVDKNINMSTIDKYLDMEGVVYRDMRMLVDPIEYGDMEGGDAYLSGYIKGFEVIPYPYLVPSDAPEGVGGQGYGHAPGEYTLFTKNNDGSYSANFVESMSIMETIFPKDKIIFLMCGGGGYAGMTKDLLVSLGWNADKIYNVGGYWTYEGGNSVSTIIKEDNGNYIYNFTTVAYHDVDFTTLTPKN